MSISVVVIAHNEEAWIARCISSILDQTVPPDEIVVVLHRCTDRTKEIVSLFPVRIVTCEEEGGPIIARARGIEAATGTIICCSDGDCWIGKEWVKNISTPLVKNKDISLVAGYTKIKNGVLWKLSCWWQFVIQRRLLHKKDHSFAWGSNFAFRKSDYEKVGGLLPFLKIHRDLKINYWAEDLYLSLALQKVGKICFALNANVFTHMPKEKSSIKAQKVIIPKQEEDNKKLFSYFGW